MNTNANKQEIGIAKIEYDKNGVVTSAEFEPTLKLNNPEALKAELSTIQCGDEPTLKYNADLVLAAWFAKVSDIELADREKYKIESEIVTCAKYPNGLVKSCTMKFFFVAF